MGAEKLAERRQRIEGASAVSSEMPVRSETPSVTAQGSVKPSVQVPSPSDSPAKQVPPQAAGPSPRLSITSRCSTQPDSPSKRGSPRPSATPSTQLSLQVPIGSLDSPSKQVSPRVTPRPSVTPRGSAQRAPAGMSPTSPDSPGKRRTVLPVGVEPPVKQHGTL